MTAFADRLNFLDVQSTGLAIAQLPDIVAETLADNRRNIVIPNDRGRFKTKIVAANLLLDFAVTLVRVE